MQYGSENMKPRSGSHVNFGLVEFLVARVKSWSTRPVNKNGANALYLCTRRRPSGIGPAGRFKPLLRLNLLGMRGAEHRGRQSIQGRRFTLLLRLPPNMACSAR